jgi:hypothetical protein
VTGIPKVAAEDTSIVASNIRGEKKTIPILKGTTLVIDTCGVHFNRECLSHNERMFSSTQKKITFFFPARYWDDPHTFKPSRFLKDWPRDAFLPFSSGEEWFSPQNLLIYILLLLLLL